MSKSMPVSRAPPVILTGGRPSTVAMRAPIARNGFAARSIGRFMSEASPINSESNRWPASKPIDKRIAVPALPMSSACGAPRSPCSPTPWTSTSVSCGRSIRTPNDCSARSVARQSSLARNPVPCVMPVAIPPSINVRWEIDLSPGTMTVPPTSRAGLTR